MSNILNDLVDELLTLSIRSHHECEDGWYSCPLSEEGCCNDEIDKNKCTCGADKHNKKVIALKEQIMEAFKNERL